MGYLVKDTLAAQAITATATTILDWAYIGDYSDLHLFVQNAGGGSADPITSVEVEYSADNGASVDSSDTTIIAVPVNTTVTKEGAFSPSGMTHARVKLNCGAGNDTTAKAWITADVRIGKYNLITVDELKSFMGITATANDSLFNSIIGQVTDQIETYCGRRFAARSYAGEQHQGDNTSLLYTKQWPVISIEKIAAGLNDVVWIECTAADAYAASVGIYRSETDPRTNSALLLLQSGGVNAGTTSLSFATYTTLTNLVAAINLLPGWSAGIVGDYGKYSPAELVPVSGISCYGGRASLAMPCEYLSDFRLNRDNGEIYYAWRWNRSLENIYLDYTAGYTVIPDALKYLCMEIVTDVFNLRKFNSVLQSETIGDYSYTKSDIQKVISKRYPDLSYWKKI